MGCAQSSNTNEDPLSNATNVVGQPKKKKVKRDSVVVTKARMKKNQGKPKEKAPSSMSIEIIE